MMPFYTFQSNKIKNGFMHHDYRNINKRIGYTLIAPGMLRGHAVMRRLMLQEETNDLPKTKVEN